MNDLVIMKSAYHHILNQGAAGNQPIFWTDLGYPNCRYLLYYEQFGYRGALKMLLCLHSGDSFNDLPLTP